MAQGSQNSQTTPPTRGISRSHAAPTRTPARSATFDQEPTKIPHWNLDSDCPPAILSLAGKRLRKRALAFANDALDAGRHHPMVTHYQGGMMQGIKHPNARVA